MSINPFNDISRASLPDPTGVAGMDDLRSMAAMEIGVGGRAVKADQSGLWLGANKWADAPFRVAMDGSVVATSITVSGYISTGGALADVGAGNITATYIGTNAVTTAKLDANAVTAAKITAGTITANEIASNAITATKINANAVTAGKIAANAIESSNIQAGQVKAANIETNTITATQIAATTITASEIATNAITADKILANSVTASEIAGNTITGSQITTSLLETTVQFISGGLAIGGSGRSVTGLDVNGTLITSTGKLELSDNIDMNEHNIDACDTIWAYTFGNRCEYYVGDPFEVLDSFKPKSGKKTARVEAMGDQWKDLDHDSLHKEIFVKTTENKKVTKGYSMNKLVGIQSQAIMQLKQEVEKLKKELIHN